MVKGDHRSLVGVEMRVVGVDLWEMLLLRRDRGLLRRMLLVAHERRIELEVLDVIGRWATRWLAGRVGVLTGAPGDQGTFWYMRWCSLLVGFRVAQRTNIGLVLLILLVDLSEYRLAGVKSKSKNRSHLLNGV